MTASREQLLEEQRAAIRQGAAENPVKVPPYKLPPAADDERARWQAVVNLGQRHLADLGAPAQRKIAVRSILDGLGDSSHIEWLLRPYLERNVLALMFGDLGTLKSFLALHWALTLAGKGSVCVYLSAEGRGLMRRARGFIRQQYPDESADNVAARLLFYAVEHGLDLSQPAVVDSLCQAVEEAAAPPQLIVVDTLARYGGALDENSAQDAAVLISALDSLRTRYGCTVLLVHHVGHGAKDRARGSYALMAATDSHFLIQRPDPLTRVITVTTGRLKDSETPPPFSMEADVVDLGTVDEDGQPETTLVLRPLQGPAQPAMKRPTGRNQKELLADLEQRHAAGETVWTEGRLREIGRTLGMHKNSARDAVLGLRTLGYLQMTVGGSILTHEPDAGPKDRNRTETRISSPDVGTEKTESPLGLGLSVRPRSLGECP